MDKTQVGTMRNSRTHWWISVFAITIISVLGFESLIYIANLYQPKIFIYLSVYVYLFIVIWLQFIFDTHFKEENYVLSFFKSLRQRFNHFLTWRHLRHFQNFLILPGIIYWGSVILIGINFGHKGLQQFIGLASSLALIVSLTLFRDVFNKKLKDVEQRHFILLNYVKIYAAWVIYAASLGIVWYYCFPQSVYSLGVFLVTFMLIYQALFQISELTFRNFLSAMAIAIIISFLSYFVYKYWNVNYFSAGIFLAAVYNLLWMLFYSIRIKKVLGEELLFEQLALFALVLVMVVSVTNFKSKIDRCPSATTLPEAASIQSAE